MGGPLLAHTCQLAGPYASFDIPCRYLEVWNTIYNVIAEKGYQFCLLTHCHHMYSWPLHHELTNELFLVSIVRGAFPSLACMYMCVCVT